MLGKLTAWWSKRPVYRVVNHPYEPRTCIVERREAIPFFGWQHVKEFRSTTTVDNSTTLAVLFIRNETRPAAPKRTLMEFDGKGNAV